MHAPCAHRVTSFAVAQSVTTYPKTLPQIEKRQKVEFPKVFRNLQMISKFHKRVPLVPRPGLPSHHSTVRRLTTMQPAQGDWLVSCLYPSHKRRPSASSPLLSAAPPQVFDDSVDLPLREPAKLQSVDKLRVQLAQTHAYRSILDRQYGHSFCGRPARLSNKNIGPKTTACGIEASTTKIACSALADLESRRIEPINPNPLQINMYEKMSIESFLSRSIALVGDCCGTGDVLLLVSMEPLRVAVVNVVHGGSDQT